MQSGCQQPLTLKCREKLSDFGGSPGFNMLIFLMRRGEVNLTLLLMQCEWNFSVRSFISGKLCCPAYLLVPPREGFVLLKLSNILMRCS